jgi:hypothetical protein
VTTVATQLLPGKEPIHFYICSGADPRANAGQPVKVLISKISGQIFIL